MKPWAEVESDPAFQSLSPSEQYDAQEQYFEDVVSPHLQEEEKESVRNQFFGEFGRRVIPKDTGQSLGQAMTMSAARGTLSVPEGIVSGIGAVSGLIPGMGDNLFSRAGGDIERWTKDTFPVNPTVADSFAVKVPEAVGQGLGFLGLTLGTAGLGATPAVASRIGLGAAGALGAEQGEETADQYDVTDPWKRAAMILGGAATEAGTEMLGGFGTKNFTESLLGAMKSATRPGTAITRGLKTIGSEGLEEVASGQLQDWMTSGLVEEDPSRPGFAKNGAALPPDTLSMQNLYNRLEEGALGAIGGVVFAGAEALGSHTPVNQALSLRMQARSVLDDLQAKETLTPEEEAQLAQVQAEDQNLGAWLERKGMDAVRPALDQIINDPEADETERTEAVQYASLIDNLEAVEAIPDVAPEELQAARDAVSNHPLNGTVNRLAKTRQDQSLKGAWEDRKIALQKQVQEAVQRQSKDPVVRTAQQTVDSVAPVAPQTAQVLQEIVNQTPTSQTDAIQEQISKSVSVRQRTQGGQGVPETYSQGSQAPTEGLQTERQVNAPTTLLTEQPDVAQLPAAAQVQGPIPDTAPQLNQLSRPVQVHAIKGGQLLQENREASPELKSTLISQKKIYTQLLNCLNS